MKTIVVVGVIMASVTFLVFGFFDYKFGCQRFENGLDARYENYRNVYDNGWKEVKEKSQVEDMWVDDLARLYKVAMEGRFGPEGSKALFQFIKEHNPSLSEKVMLSIQQSVESFRNEFQQAGTEVIDYKMKYNNFRTTTWNGAIFGGISGYPKVDLAKFVVVTSEETENVFKEKKAPPIKLRD